MSTHPVPTVVSAAPSPMVWELPKNGLSVLYGLPAAPRLFHYFLPRAIQEEKSVLCLDGANRFDPLLIARFARERRMEFGASIRVARAFTCFQLTELLVRLPRLLQTFPAQLVIVTALPDLYFDEDVHDRQAMTSFHRALDALKQADQLSVPVAVFTDATSSHSPRRTLFQALIAQADHVLRFTPDKATGITLTTEKSAPAILKR